ncbi:MAG: hypothetical protein Q9166_006960 [cf. Caloplaca sp. 2 TL-2023]
MAESSSLQASKTAKPPLKRPLFTKPTWAQQDNSGSATDFFRRSNQSYLNIAAEAERKRQRKSARKQRERAAAEKNLEPTHKRRRTSSDSNSADNSDRSRSDDGIVSQIKSNHNSPGAPKAKVSKTKQPSTPPEPKPSPKSLSERYQTAADTMQDNVKQKPPPSNIIDLEDEDEDDLEVHQEDIVEVAATKRPEPIQDDDNFSPSDDEYAELARKAREKARRKRLEADVPRPTDQNDRLIRADSVHKPPDPPAAPDPVVSILVTSRIPNTKPLIVNRRVSQRLKDVRLTWCQRQGFTPDTTETIFLTWRGKRLFDVTTCRSLGIGIDNQGNIVMKGQKDILGEEERQMHMEAMTDGILEEHQRAKRQEARGQGQDETEVRKEQPPAPETKEPQVRIILKAKGLPDFKLIVKPVSSVISPKQGGIPLLTRLA